jgi:hypothetical protein
VLVKIWKVPTHTGLAQEASKPQKIILKLHSHIIRQYQKFGRNSKAAFFTRWQK